MKLMPIRQAIEQVSGQRVSPPTATRWALKGCGGVILRSVLLGKKRLSSIEWVNEFIAARSQPTAALDSRSTTRAELDELLGKRN